MITDAFWIGSEIEECPEFVREISVSKPLKNVNVMISSIGVYEAFINGQRIGDFVLAPGCTVYKKRLQYQNYDITEMVKEKNLLTVRVGRGWYRGRISEKLKDINTMPCALIAQIQIIYEDGTIQYISTDADWRVRKSKIKFSDIYDGEIYDASFSDFKLHKVKLLEGIDKSNLIKQEGVNVCEHERIKPARYFITSNGERVIDFGQNMAGYVELSVDAKGGEKIELSHAEVINAEGNFYTENYRKAKAKIEYICTKGKQSYKPHFTFFGFRYIRLDEYPFEVDLNNFTAISLYSDINRTGYLESSNSKLNRFIENVLWSQRSNFIDIPTDCPQRDERMGWLGDAQVFAKAACFNYNVKHFFEKWMNDVCADQFDNGAVPDTVPNFWGLKKSSTAWGDAITIIPWQVYLMYGDKKILENCFSAMKKWVDYITNDTKTQFLWTCEDSEKRLWGKHYGDWLALDAPTGSYKGSTNEDFIASVFYYYSVGLLVKAGKVLNEDMTEYELLCTNILTEIKKHFNELKTQTEHVLALCFNLTDNKEETAKELAEMVKQNGNRLETGFVGTTYLLYALSENGYTDVAYSLLLQEEYPSWLYEVNHGATTIWEHWDGVKEDGSFWSSDMNSYNHYAYGSVIDWIYTVAAGIKTQESYPGFQKCIIEPHPNKKLNWLNASVKTVSGEVSSKWTYTREKIIYEIVTPSSAVVLIDEKEYNVEKGSYIFYGKLK